MDKNARLTFKATCKRARRRRAEDALLDASRFNQQIIADAKEGVIVYDRNLKYQVWNPFMEELTGLPATQVIGKQPLEVFPFLKTAGVMAQLRRALAGKTCTTVDFHFHARQSKRSGWVSDTNVPLRNGKGKIIGVIGIVSDITERKQVEDSLRAREEELAAIYDNTPQIVLLVDNRLRVRKMNKFAREFIGDSSSHQLRRRLGNTLHCRHSLENPKGCGFGSYCRECKLRRIVTETLQTGRSHHQVEATLSVTLPGQAQALTVLLSTTKFSLREQQYVVATIQDISERKRAEERITQLNRVQAILVGVDHAIVHISDRQKLLDEVCRVAVEKGGFKLAWIGLVSPDSSIQPVAKAGVTDYLKRIIPVVTHDVPEGRGAVGTAIRENRPVMIGDMSRDERTAPWRERARQFNLNYVAAFPIRIAGKAAGAFVVYAPKADFFDEKEVALLIQVSDDVSFALSALADLSARKEAEESLRRSENNLSIFFNQAPIGLIWMSAGGTILRANQTQLDLLGYAAEDYVGQSFIKFCKEPAQGLKLLQRLVAKETVCSFPMTRLNKDGTIRHVLVDAKSFWNGNQFQYSSVFLRDVTELFEMEREILQAGERERRRMAQDLHDGLGQLLAGTAYLTGILRQKLAAKSLPETRQLGRIQEVINEAITQTRGLARGLHPVEPLPNGLVSALETLADRTKKLFHVHCRFNCPRPVLIHDNAVATHLFRIAQEAITNAIKHGRPGRIEIGLTETPERINLLIKDNGAGMAIRRRRKPGMGLRIMRYRAGMIGGSLTVQKTVGRGTTVVCMVQQSSGEGHSGEKTEMVDMP